MATLSKKREYLFSATQLVIHKLEVSNPLYISVDFIRSLHKELYGYYKSAAGNFRTPVYGAKVGSKTFQPVPAYQIKYRLIDLSEFINKPRVKASYYRNNFSKNIPNYKKFTRKERKFWYAIYCASYVHHQITLIHPFTGGNGRLARLLMSMELANHGLYRATYPPLLNEVIRQNRNKYLNALSQADKGEIEEFCYFLADMLILAVKVEDNLRKKKVKQITQSSSQ